MKRLTRKLMVFTSLLIMAFSFMLFYPAKASADETTNSILSQFEYLNVNYDGTLGFIYNDGFFFLGNNYLSPELAKVSISLASAAYDLNKNGSYEELPSVLAGLNCSYTLYNYDKSHTGDDFDWVRYAIATREVSFQGQNYIIYIVPIQGTSGSYDWFGNAKLGTGSDHEGFYIAANKVMQELSSVMSGDGYSYDTRIILTTGHSRGAAVSNIIAGKLTEGASGFISPIHVFSYNFACPSVSTNANENFQNIYNFNSGDDLVPVVPLEDWGYSRYGVTIELPYADLNNVRQRFSSYTGSEYVGTYETPIYIEDVLKRAIPNNAAANDLTEPILKGLAFCMGNANGSMKDFFSVMDIDISENRLSAFRRGFEYSEEGFQNSLDYWNDVAELIPRYLNETEPMTEEGYNGESFSAWFERNRAEIEKMEKVFNYNISASNVNSFIQDIKAIQALVVADQIKTVTGVSVPDPTALTKLLTCGAELYIYFHNGGSVTAVGHGHMSQTYLLWINSMYFGYSGWRNNTQQDVCTIFEPVLTIAPYCFTGSSISLVSPMDSVCYFADNSFYDSGLRYLNISDVTIADNALSSSSYLSQVAINNNVIIGHDAFSNCGWNAVMNVVINGTEIVIGDDAFSNCGSEQYPMNLSFGEGFTLGNYILDNSYIGTLELPSNYIESIPENRHPFHDYKYPYTDLGYTVNNLVIRKAGNGEMPDGTYEQSILGNVKEAEFQEGIIHIGASILIANNAALTKVELPSTLKSIGASAFAGQRLLEQIKLPSGLTSIEGGAFHNTGLTSVALPSSLKNIGGGTFSGTYITEIRLSDVTLGVEAFSDCSKLTFASLRNVKTGVSAFARCGKLSQVMIGADVKLGNAAFSYCGKSAIMNVVINGPDTIIGDYAFQSSGSETYPLNVSFGEGFTLGNYILDNSYIGTLELPSNYIEGIPENTHSFHDYKYPYTDLGYTVNNLVIRKAGNGEMPDGTYEQSILGIVKEAEFQEGIIHIGASILIANNATLTKVELPSTLKSIGNSAFSGCTSLQDIYYTGDQAAWNDISISDGNNPLLAAKLHLDFDPSTLTPDLILPTALMTIEDEAFTGGAFVYVKLPDKAVSIGWHAFANCPNLAYIYIPALTTQIDEEAFGTMQSLTILGKTGTTAETYANDHSFTFIAVS